MNASIRTAAHRSPIRWRAALVSALLAVGMVAAVAGAASPARAETSQPDVTWGVRTGVSEHGEGRDNYAYEVDAGETVRDAIIIANYDDEPLVLDVYAADGLTTSSGQLDVAARDVRPRRVGAWVVPAADRVTVQPGESLEVPFTIAVPGNATPGDHAGGILTTLTSSAADGVTVDRRLGIRIHLRVGGDLAPGLTVEGLNVSYAGTLNPFGTGGATVSYTVRNSGNTRLSSNQTVTLAGPFGIFPVDAPTIDAVPELLPGEGWPVSVRVEGALPLFVLTGTVVLEPQTVTASTPTPASVEASASTVAVPWTSLVLLLLLAGGVAVWIVAARRGRANRKKREDARVEEAVARTLREHAQPTVETPASGSETEKVDASGPRA